MNREHLWNILKTKYAYQSPQKRKFLAMNLPGWAAFMYYSRLSKLVFQESSKACKGQFNRMEWADASFASIRIAESAGGILNVSGLKGITEHNGPFVYIANHMSMADTFIIPCLTLIFGDVTFVIKEGLLNYPVFGHVMRATHPIALKRKNPREDLKTVLNTGQDFISKGCSVIIFPQATRNVVFDTSSFNSLGVKLARKAGVPVVPIALKTNFHGNGKFLKEMGPIDPKKTIYLKFGNPMEVEGNGHVTHQKIVEFISKNLKEWGGKVREQKTEA